MWSVSLGLEKADARGRPQGLGELAREEGRGARAERANLGEGERGRRASELASEREGASEREREREIDR